MSVRLFIIKGQEEDGDLEAEEARKETKGDWEVKDGFKGRQKINQKGKVTNVGSVETQDTWQKIAQKERENNKHD